MKDNKNTGAPSESGRVAALESELRSADFRGDIFADWGSRVAASTDNSVYQITPDVILAPRNLDDLRRAVTVLNAPEFRDMPFTARGAGTGTNGQSLNTGVVIDFRRHMRKVIDVDVEGGWAEAEAGVVRDELNDILRPLGYFFSPSTSTANRCTIGGMIGTDASGQGSRVYGKTGDNILSLTVVLADGRTFDAKPLACDAEGGVMADNEEAGISGLLTEVKHVCDCHRETLRGRVPDLRRRFVGYDLVNTATADQRFDPSRLFVGAEGTLGLVAKSRVKLTKLPKFKRLLVIGYKDFAAALGSARSLLRFEPTAIETIDDTIQEIAHREGLTRPLPEILRTPQPDGRLPVCNFVEYAGDDLGAIETTLSALKSALDTDDTVVGWHEAKGEEEATRLWAIRSGAVGLLGGVTGRRRPVPFVEDCVVPPENLSVFAMEFRTLLESEGVTFGMFGHVDVGCIHVRPALDISDAADRQRLKRISDAVLALVRKHGGIFWGEHGKGVRGQYLREFVGDEVYGGFARIKGLFDPHNRLNPGKLVSPSGDPAALWPIEATPFRETNVDVETGAGSGGTDFENAFRCNGNAQCQSYSTSVTMCPSYKGTGDPRHSPKGRADLLRAWWQLERVGDPTANEAADDVYAALDGCLGCKACTSTCPIHVDIPEMKSLFLDRYHEKKRRPLLDRMLALSESQAPMASRFAPIANLFLGLSPVKWFNRAAFGLVDTPAFSVPTLRARLAADGAAIQDSAALKRLVSDKSVIVVLDTFTTHFEADAVMSVVSALGRLGYEPIVTPAKFAGMTLHVKGFRRLFRKTAENFTAHLRGLAESGRPLVVVDAALAALLRQEYRRLLGDGAIPEVMILQEFLANELSAGRDSAWPKDIGGGREVEVLLHCTERTAFPLAGEQWRRVLNRLGFKASAPAMGCCGMAGAYGHEARHLETSKRLFDIGWAGRLGDGTDKTRCATGFSCRDQTERFTGRRLPHPLALLD